MVEACDIAGAASGQSCSLPAGVAVLGTTLPSRVLLTLLVRCSQQHTGRAGGFLAKEYVQIRMDLRCSSELLF